MHELISNKAVLKGRVATLPSVSHKVYGEAFLEFDLAVQRTSGYTDRIPVTVSQRLLSGQSLSVGQPVFLQGQIRTYNRFQEGKNRLLITVFVQSIERLPALPEGKKDENRVELSGFLCKPPYYRVSPLGREISDLMLAVNRMYGKSDYIPCIAWGRNAKYAKTLSVGQKIKITGRIQSREYQKKRADGTIADGIAREVSVYQLEDGI